jgi:hypothetical protein
LLEEAAFSWIESRIRKSMKELYENWAELFQFIFHVTEARVVYLFTAMETTFGAIDEE